MKYDTLKFARASYTVIKLYSSWVIDCAKVREIRPAFNLLPFFPFLLAWLLRVAISSLYGVPRWLAGAGPVGQVTLFLPIQFNRIKSAAAAEVLASYPS